MPETLDSPQKQILEFIINNPSTHLRKIKNNVGFSMGTIQYHLNILEKEGKIKSVKTKFYKNYYHITESDEKVLSVFNLESPRSIILYLLQHEPSTHQEITKGIELSSSTVSWHMKRLLDLDIVDYEYSGKYTLYRLTNRENVLENLRKCKSTVWNSMVNNMVDVFSAFEQK
ncbi:transcriptional regulator TrmB protein [Marine Group I thaumarchaeote SCGC RSA3]|uniref:Transcriptional regulator TrmB protein n=3 Tax=Marine Group I TaxID=905826 RepID=A0A081RNY2_9ARCH|nr:transcriptional regulator TrmB protein [Marine Group I thaumarchaeote SCGC AAA799-N04]KFM15672.1 transcriptional regulator TrmB protein [Marine Group I thaumarchaeote SCGC AAA799-D11]KFM16803.1 transcriptional regulator TrmB protein [Marine Group I thaumarchaeote SCGC RSA3]